MFLFSKKELSIIEYMNPSVTTPRVHLRASGNTHPSLSFNGARLSYAIAKTLTKKTLRVPELWYDSVMSWLGINSLIAESTEFKFRESRISRLRDFTKTSRIGEIAQGIAYLFAQDTLRYKFIIDFEQFFTDRNIPLINGMPTPDFIIQNNINNQIALLESKGTEINATTSIKSILRDGLAQCQSGSNFSVVNGFNVINKYVTCVEFSTDAISTDSFLHFVDPIEKENAQRFDDTIMRYHFASWFYLIGDFNNVARLINSENIVFEDNLYEIRNYNKESYYVIKNKYFIDILIDNINSNFYNSRINAALLENIFKLDENGFEFGISQKVISHLRGIETLTDFPVFETFQIDGFEFFIDGIILRINNSNK